jgi:thioredoxin-related protein
MKKNNGIIMAITFIMLLISTTNVTGYNLNHQYTNLQGNSANLNQFAGEYLFLDAFSSKCSICASDQQHNVLTNIYSDVVSDSFSETLQMVSISVTVASQFADSLQDIQAFVASKPKNWEVGLDHSRSFHTYYGITGTPTMILFNPDGLEVYRWVGFTGYSAIAMDIESILSGEMTVTPIQPGDSQNVGGSGSSILGDFFGNRIVQIGIVMGIIMMIYFYSTGKKN